MKPEIQPTKGPSRSVNDIPIDEIVDALKHVRHGYVQIVVQDGKVIQIETHEKKRLDRA